MIVNVIKQNRKTISARWVNEEELEVRVPYGVTQSYVDCFLSKNARAIEKAREKLVEKRRKQSEAGYYYLGKNYPVESRQGEHNRVNVKEDLIVVEHTMTKSPAYVLELFEKKEAKRILSETVDKCMALFPGLPYPTITYRSMKTRWGSCAYRKGKITLNTKLIHVPYVGIEYVVLHELLHFIYPNHQKEFHAQLEALLPHHRKVEKLLHEYGFVLEEWK